MAGRGRDREGVGQRGGETNRETKEGERPWIGLEDEYLKYNFGLMR